MHEMALAESVLQIIKDSARTQNFQRVRSLTLEIGKLSSVEPDAMRFCLDVVTRGSLAENAIFHIIETPGVGLCLTCNATIPMQEQYGLCPHCNSPQLKITGGNQMRVKDLEVE